MLYDLYDILVMNSLSNFIDDMKHKVYWNEITQLILILLQYDTMIFFDNSQKKKNWQLFTFRWHWTESNNETFKYDIDNQNVLYFLRFASYTVDFWPKKLHDFLIL